MQLTQQTVIRKTDPRYKEILDLCHKSKNLYNTGLYAVRQHYFQTSKYLNYYDCYRLLKSETNPDLYNLPSQTAQQILKLIDRNFKSFFRSLKLAGKHNIPQYKDKSGYLTTVYTNQQIRKTKLEKGLISVPGLDCTFKTNIRQIDQLRFVPQTGCIKMEVVYSVPDTDPLPDNGRYISIDLGINNLTTLVFSDGRNPVIINGRSLKSVNQYYNKKKALLQSISATNKLNHLTLKRNSKVLDYLHKTSRWIVNLAVSNNYNTIIVGYNKQWKQDTNLGTRLNQQFVSIPHHRLLSMLDYKCRMTGIKLVTVDEAWTSKASSLDRDAVPDLDCDKPVFSGRRLKRGLYASKSGLVNADVNGAINIMRKVSGDEIECISPASRGFVFNPVRIEIF